MKLNLDQVKEYIRNTSSSTNIYIGSDSVRFKKGDIWFAEYATVIVVHHDGCRGCKIFGQLESERDYDQKRDKPRMRHVEIHLDINPNERYGSSCVISEAVGYIKGMCNVVPFVKPQAFAASIAADRLLA